MATALESLNRVQFSGFDFDTWLDELRARTQVKFGAYFNDWTQSSLGVLLFDHVAFGLESLGFYVDRRASDLLLYTSRTRHSVAVLTRQLGYKMASAVASSVDEQVTLAAPHAFDVTLIRGYQFKTDDGVIFEVAEATTYLPGEVGPKTIPCYEGTTITETFFSNGAANQEFNIQRVPEGKFIASGRTSCIVDGFPWTEMDFLSYEETDQYEIATNEDPPKLRFGDGVAGNIPTAGASIVLTYVATYGKAGRVGEGTITSEVNPLVVNFQRIALTATNPESASGGDDPEDLEQAKSFAGRVWKTRDVAVTQEDHETLAGSFADPVGGRVAVAKAFVSRTASSDLLLQSEMIIIRSAVSEPVPIVTGAIDDANAALDEVDASLVRIADFLAEVATNTSNIDNDLIASTASARSSKNSAVEIGIDGQDIRDEVFDLDTIIDGIGGGGATDELTDPTYDAIKALTSKIDAEAGLVITAASSIQAASTSEVGSIGSARDKLGDIGLTVAAGYLNDIDDERAAIATEVGTVGPPATGIRQDLETIGDAVTDVVSIVNDALVTIEDHVDKILSNDCKANLVTVPILVRDSGGFYAAPSMLLIRQLQDFLDARKEVTQTVEVVSGERFLVPAVLSVRLGVLTGYAESVVETTVIAAIDGVLRDRVFGASLYLDELYAAVNGIDGIAFRNIAITGYDDGGVTRTDKLDGNGNLILGEGEVITKGSLVVDTEASSPLI